MDYYKQNRRLTVFKTLANTNRINIIKTIAQAPSGFLNVNEIAEKLKMPQPKISDHLKLMRMNKILTAKQAGTIMNY